MREWRPMLWDGRVPRDIDDELGSMVVGFRVMERLRGRG